MGIEELKNKIERRVKKFSKKNEKFLTKRRVKDPTNSKI